MERINLINDIVDILFNNYVFNSLCNIDFERKEDLSKIDPKYVSCIQLVGKNHKLIYVLLLHNNTLYYFDNNKDNLNISKLVIPNNNDDINLIDKRFVINVLKENNLVIDDFSIFVVNNHDINIKKYFNNSLNFKPFNKNSTNKTIYYNDQHENYYNDLLDIDNIYHFGSFDRNDLGLQNSQLKTFVNVIDFFKEKNNKYFPINGGPGTGKSTILNYIISNVLVSSFFQQIQNVSNPFVYLISKNYQIPKILLTGSTKESVNNISDVCSLDNSDKYKSNSSELSVWLSKIDYAFSENKKQENNKHEKIENDDYKILHNSLVSYLNNKYEIDFAIDTENVVNFLVNKIKENTNLINNILSKLIYVLENRNKDSKIFLFADQLRRICQLKNGIKFKKQIKLFFQFVDNEADINEKLLNSLRKYIRSSFFYLKPSKLIKKKINKLLNTNLDEFKKTWDSNIKFLFNFVKNTGIEDFKEYENKDDDYLINSDDDLALLSFIKTLEVNFNNIQRYIDVSLRDKSTIIYREIHELLFFYNKDRNLINPIISGNVQGINTYTLKQLFNSNETVFDLTIVDEAGQMNSKYILFLNQLSNKIITVGDVKQLSPITEENEIIKRIKYYNSLNGNSNSNLLDFCENIFYENGNFIPSLLEWINLKSNIISDFSENNKETKYKTGSFLLEHFRCPKLVFDKINYHFYDNIMNFKGQEFSCHNKYECFKNIHLVIKYKNNNENVFIKNNEQEIDIFKKFVTNNIDWILSHNTKNINHEKYISKNIAFVSLYRDQCLKIKEELKDFKVKDISFKNIKIGTIDSLQGIGCDFVFFSNVTIEIGDNKNSSKIAWKSIFEFNRNRINVLYTRTKKHFIQIMSEDYYNNVNDSSMNWRKQMETEDVTIVNDLDYKIPICFDGLPITNKQIQTGFDGECLFNDILSNSLIKYLLVKRIRNQLDIDVKYIINHKWCNLEGESHEPYDFIIFSKNENYYIDIKSTNLDNYNCVYASKKELEFSNNLNYLIGRISNLNRILYFKSRDLCSLGFLLKNIEFFKNNKDVNENEFINNSNKLEIIVRNKNS